MKLYYTPIELPEEPAEQKTADPSVEKWPSKEQFDIINNRILQELNHIQTGISKLTTYAIKFSHNEPVMNAFNKLRSDPTKKNWVNFMLLVEQDLGTKVLNKFEEWFSLIFKGTVTYKGDK